MPGSAEHPSAKREFERGEEEFGRVLAFSDGMFAIAMTLLVVGIAVPTLSDPDSVGELADDLNETGAQVISFFISFAVIGRYWVAHHQMFSLLRAFDRGMIGINLLYLAFVAFLPFPTALLGTYFDNPLAVAIYAFVVALISGFEVLLLRHAHRHGLLQAPMPESVYRWGRTLSLTPVGLFLISIPIAFASSILAVAVWVLNAPIGLVGARLRPPGTDEYFE